MSAIAATSTDSLQENFEAGKVRTAVEPVTPHGQSTEPPKQQEIEQVAYALWKQRGCPLGSPEFDWFEAERILRDAVHRR